MKRLSIVLAVLGLAGTAACLAAEPAKDSPAAPSQAGEPLDELDEVVVRGKDLTQAIVKAEDEYFAIFNDVNKDDRYDTHCVALRLNNDSRIQSRVCMPGFVADAMADWAPFKARCQPPQEGGDEFACLDRNGDGRLSKEEAGARVELEASFELLDKSGSPDGYLRRDEFDASCRDCSPADLPSPPVVYMPPPPQLVLMEGSQKWYDQMLKVTNSDPRLKKMADHLGGLYHELAATQRQFEKLEAEAKPKGGKPNLGPRRQ